jgi:protein ImuB
VTLARIRKLVGEGNVGCPVPLNTHRPDAFRIVAFQHSSDRYGAATTGSGSLFGSRLAIRLFRPALEARVEIAAGHPGHVSSRGIRGKVVHRGGPWRGSGDWWNPIAWSRDEWDVALSDGALYRIFRTAGGWFIDGRYD